MTSTSTFSRPGWLGSALYHTARGTAEAAEAINAAAPEDEQAAAAEQRASQIEAWRFFNEWSEIARADIKRRDWLIQAGLAKRKPAKKKSGGDK